MPFFRKPKSQMEIPVGAEREDLLADIARRTGERKQQVQSLLEEYARQEDERFASLSSQARFDDVLREVEPAAAKTPVLSMERRWSTRPEPAPPSADIAGLESRIAALEREQRKLVGIVEGLISILNTRRSETTRAAER